MEEVIKESKQKRHLKKKFKILLGIILMVILLIIILFSLYSFMLAPVSNTSNKVEFEIEPGTSVYSVGKKLEKEGIIKSVSAYKAYVKLHNINSYKAGFYQLDKSYSSSKIIDILSGDSYKENITITFKEGKTIRNIAKTIAKYTDINESEVFAKLEDENYINSMIEKYWFLTDDIKNKDIYYPLEGYLFPDTYSFNKNVTVEEIFTVMLDQTDKVFTTFKDKIESSKYSINEIVTLASIVESEGIYDDDRKMIAGVFFNRLNSNMSLGSDVTTYYAFKVDLGERDLTSKEINTYNPYNTRGPQMSGKLPVGAISNYGKTSLDAVLNPTMSSYYYFVADKSGKTHFTKTYDEHLNIIKELKAANNWIEW